MLRVGLLTTPWFRVTHREVRVLRRKQSVRITVCGHLLCPNDCACRVHVLHCGKTGVSSMRSTGTPPGSGECVLSRLPKSQRETFDHSVLYHLVHSPEWAAVEMRASAYSCAPPTPPVLSRSWNAMLLSMSWLPSLSAAALSEPSAVRKLCCAPCHSS